MPASAVYLFSLNDTQFYFSRSKGPKLSLATGIILSCPAYGHLFRLVRQNSGIRTHPPAYNGELALGKEVSRVYTAAFQINSQPCQTLPQHLPAPRIAETAAGKNSGGPRWPFLHLPGNDGGGRRMAHPFPSRLLSGGSPPAVLLLYSPGIQDSQPRTARLAGPGSGRRLFPCPGMVFPWFYYESVADLGLIATAIVMFAAGTYAGAGNGEKSILPVLAAALGLLNALLWGYQNITGTEASWFRPDYSLFGTEIRNIGLFGYKIFPPISCPSPVFSFAHTAWLPPENGASACSRDWRSSSFPSRAARDPPSQTPWLA